MELEQTYAISICEAEHERDDRPHEERGERARQPREGEEDRQRAQLLRRRFKRALEPGEKLNPGREDLRIGGPVGRRAANFARLVLGCIEAKFFDFYHHHHHHHRSQILQENTRLN